jgi:hypothetical protein
VIIFYQITTTRITRGSREDHEASPCDTTGRMTSRRAGSFFNTPTHGRDTNEGLKTGAFQRHRRSATRVIGGPLVFSARVRSDRLEQCDELMDFFYILFFKSRRRLRGRPLGTHTAVDDSRPRTFGESCAWRPSSVSPQNFQWILLTPSVLPTRVGFLLRDTKTRL